MTITRHEVGPRLSQCVSNGDTVYLAGQTASDQSADVAGQTTQILARMDELLGLAGTDQSEPLAANIWISDMSTFAEMNAICNTWLSPGDTPVRACVESNLARPKITVEIMVTAAL